MRRTWKIGGSERQTHQGGGSDCGTTDQTIAARNLASDQFQAVPVSGRSSKQRRREPALRSAMGLDSHSSLPPSAGLTGAGVVGRGTCASPERPPRADSAGHSLLKQAHEGGVRIISVRQRLRWG